MLIDRVTIIQLLLVSGYLITQVVLAILPWIDLIARLDIIKVALFLLGRLI